MTEDRELREILRATAQNAALPTVMPQSMRRKVSLRRGRTIAVTLLTTVAIAVGGFQGMRAVTLDDAAPAQPAGEQRVEEPKVTDLPYLIDLKTRDMTPLPEAITGSLATGRFDKYLRVAASPDGSSLAFVGEGVDGTPQIFTSGIDGTGLRQVTHEPIRAIQPAWSPDGTRIAYLGYGSVDVPNIFVLELATGQSNQVTAESPILSGGLQFTPDGSSILFTRGSEVGAELRTVPVSGGESTLLFDPQARGFDHTFEGSLSPDGSLVTFMGNRIGGPGAARFVTNADGTDWRSIGSCISNPAGTWSPDGSRIVCGPNGPPPGIRVKNIATWGFGYGTPGDTTFVAKGQVAIWLDDDTLLVD